MSGLMYVFPAKWAGPRLLKLASESVMVVAPTVNESSYWAGGPSLPMVSQNGPELPAATTTTMPASRRLCTTSASQAWVHPSRVIEQNHELLMATGAFVGSGFWWFRSHGASMYSMQPRYVSWLPKPPEFIER